MSRIGRLEIVIPDGVKINFDEANRLIKVNGPKGELTQSIKHGIEFDIKDGKIQVNRKSNQKQLKALHGLYRSLINNMVTGVSQGFTRRLELNGVGYRPQSSGKKVTFSVGYSHPVEYELPEGVSCQVTDSTVVELAGSDKQLLGQVAANMRKIRPPEPYKKKGIKYAEERIRAKAGKSAK